MFMQAGFAFLEIGFSRAKNAGTVIAKILTNFSIAGLCYWAVGFAIAFGGPVGHIIGTHGLFLRDFGDPAKAFPIMGLPDATIESKWFFQFVFCAVSLAIVWGTTLAYGAKVPPDRLEGLVANVGRQKGITEHYRGAELPIHLRPKLRLECVVDDDSQRAGAFVGY
jgi:hypothetical protein